MALLALALLIPRTRDAAFAVWIFINVLAVAGGAVWALFHLKSTLFVSRAGRWAFWLTLVSFLAGYSGLGTLSAVNVSWLPATFSSLIPLLAILLVPFVYVLFWFAGGIGAALAAMANRRGPLSGDYPRTGVCAWWLSCLPALFLWAALGVLRAPDDLRYVSFAGIPLLSLMVARWLLNPSRGSIRIGQSISAALARRLVWRRQRRGARVTVDLRGAALGLTGGLLALAFSKVELLTPFQTSALVGYIQVRNALTSRVGPLSSNPERSRINTSSVVILQMDSTIRYAALTSRSETAIQADVIRRLTGYGVVRIVLPLPLLDDRTAALPRVGIRGPRPNLASIERSIRDLPRLVSAVRDSKNTILSLPLHYDEIGSRLLVDDDQGRKDPSAAPLIGRVQLLRSSAREVGIADLGAFGTPSLTSLSTQWLDLPEVPFVALAAIRNRPLAVRSIDHGDRVTVAGRSLWTIGPNTVLVAGSEPDGDHDLPRISYNELMNDEPVYAGQSARKVAVGVARSRDSDPIDVWSKPSSYLRDKIVFLDSIAWDPRETPSGQVPRTRVLAGATDAVITGRLVHAQRRSIYGLFILLLGALIGHLCARRNPLDSALPVITACSLVAGYSALVFMDDRVFIDPVTPICAVIAAFALAAQFTFTQESAARERNRALLQRFVAPQFIEELLDDPEGKLGLGGRRCDICVIFADIRNFTRFAETHSPEQVVEAVNAYMTAMTDALHASGGVLDKYTGDGLMAFFLLSGDPREGLHTSVAAALAMRDAAIRVSEKLESEQKAPLHVGIGLHYGPAVVGIVGNPVHQVNYTALGETVVISARLQGLAAGGEVVISETIYGYVSAAFKVSPGDPVYVKGITGQVRPYRVIAADPTGQPEVAPQLAEANDSDDRGLPVDSLSTD